MSYQDDIEFLHRLSRADIDDMLTRASLNKARDYQRQRRVINREVGENTIYAQVRGSEPEPYDVEISVEDGEVYAGCTCPYELSGWCKHIGAVLLEWIENRGSFNPVDKRQDSLFEQDDLDWLDDEDEDENWFEDEDEDVDLPQDAPPVVNENLFEQELQNLLGRFKIDELREIARQRRINLTVTRKEEIVQMLAERLADRDQVQALIAQSDDLSRRILTFLHLYAPPGYGTPLNYIQPLGLKGQSNEAIRQRVESMARQALIIPFTQNKIVYYVLPQISRLCLPPLPGEVDPWPLAQVSQLNVERRDFAMLTQKLYRLWTYLHEHQPRRALLPPADPIESQWNHLTGWRHDPDEIAQARKGGQYFAIPNQALSVPPAPYYLTEADQSTLCRLLNASPEEIEFYCALLNLMGALSGEAGEIIQTERSAIQTLLSMPLDLQLAVLTSTWQEMVEWSEMDGILRSVKDIGVRRNVTYTTYKLDDLYEEWQEGRQSLIRFLILLDEDTWVSVEALQHKIHELRPNLAHAMSHSGVWWLESTRKKKQFGAGFEDWLISYGRLVVATLTGPLAWLGILDLGYQDGRLAAVRLTPAGAFILGRRQRAFAPPRTVELDRAVRFNDDLTVDVMPGMVSMELYALLNTMARLENATPQHLSYHLDANSVHHLYEQGATAQTLIERLNQFSPAPVSAAWQRRLREWETHYGQLHLYQGIALIELADDFALQELLASTSLRDHLVYQFSNRLIAVQPQAVDGLVQEMEKRGHTPRITG